MSKLMIGTVVLVISSLLGGCAGVSFYADKELKSETGIPIPSPKPYLLVARTEQKDNPVQVSIIYLPDFERVIYAKPRSGFGSAKLSLALSNGQLTSFGQDTDTKIPELLTSLAGVRTAIAGADKTAAEADEIRAKALHGTKSAVQVGAEVSAVAADMKSKLSSKALAGLNKTQLSDVVAAQTALELAGKVLQNAAAAPLATSQLAIVKAQAGVLEKISSKGTDPVKEAGALNLVAGWVSKLKETYQEPAAGEELPEKATFELYEIVQSSSGSFLNRVNLKDVAATVAAP